MSFPGGGMTVTNEDVGSVAVFNNAFLDDTFDPRAAATTYPAGTILSRETASGKLRNALVGEVDGTQTPVGVLQFDVTSDAVPSDVPIRYISFGEVNEAKLIFAPAAVGVLTPAQVDLLRTYAITPRPSEQLAGLDNQ